MHKLKENAHDKWMTYLYMRKADQNKYGSLMKGFKTQYSLDNYQYPKTMLKATTVLTSHKWDDKYYSSKKNQKNNNNNDGKKSEEQEGTNLHQKDRSHTMCFCCGQKGHFQINAQNKKKLIRK